MNDIIFIQNNLKKWIRDEKAPDIALLNTALNPRIRKDPIGVVLVIGYGYPNCSPSFTKILMLTYE
jgi:beta-apo-4'-carotenal oxygenase